SMQDSGAAIRHAAAQARALLIAAAAARMALTAERLRVENGAIVADDGQRLGYGELVGDRLLHARAEPQAQLTEPGRYRLIGKDMPRVDLPAKVTGGVAYVQDLRLPDVAHARIVLPPAYGA